MPEFLLGLVTAALFWHAIRMLREIKPDTAPNTYTALFIGLIVWASASAGGWWGLIAIFLSCSSGVLWWDTFKNARKRPPEPAQDATAIKQAAPLPKDWKTRLNFKSRTPGKTWEASADSESPEDAIDTVMFDYRNAGGEYSSRRIAVLSIDDDRFDGIDLDIQEKRTFRLDRVVGDITSETSGMIADPEAWAESIRDYR